MDQILAKNVKRLRDMKHWTQQHLADASGAQLRTVQRVEKGEGASLDTLGALAAAFDVTIDLLRFDVDAVVDQMQKEQEEVERTHYFVDVAPITCSAHLGIIGGSHAYLMHCASEDDAIQDLFAEFESNVKDMVDVWEDVDPSNHRGWLKEAYEQVEELNRRGVAVSIGKAIRTMRQKGVAGTFEWRVLYVVGWPKGQEKSRIAVPKDMSLA